VIATTTKITNAVEKRIERITARVERFGSCCVSAGLNANATIIERYAAKIGTRTAKTFTISLKVYPPLSQKMINKDKEIK
jgi:hypothetical protein